MLGRWMVVGALSLSACYDMPGAPPAEAPERPSRRATEGGVFPVLDAAGRTLLPLGEARRSPKTRGSPTVIAAGVAVEFADEHELSEKSEFTVVDAAGTCVTRAKSRLLIGRHEADAAHWTEGIELEGCRGDPSQARLAIAGAAAAARWIHPQEATFIDGELATGSQFLDRELDGKKVVRQYQFAGLDVVLETEYVAPARGVVPLKLMRGKQVLATFPGARVAGGVGLVDRLLIVLQGRGLTVVELVDGEAMTLLSPDSPAPDLAGVR